MAISRAENLLSRATISKPTDAELSLYNGGSPDGLWAPIMEKSFGRYATDVLKRPQTGLANQDTAAGGDPYWR